MASGGTLTTSSYEGRRLQLRWDQVSQDIVNNTTTIKWTLSGTGEASAGYYMAGNFKVVIDGTTVYSSADRIELYNGTVVATGTYTIRHNADGTRQFTVYAEAGIYNVAVNCKGEGVATLNNIPQVADFTVTDGTLGVPHTISITRKNTAFTHGVTYSCGSVATQLIIPWNSTTASVSFTFPVDLAWQAPNGNKVWVDIHLQTYRSDGTTVGNVITKGVWMIIPDSVKPTCTVEVSDPTGYADKFGAFIQGQSQMAIKVTPTTAYGSAISGYLITADGKRFTTAEATTSVILSSGTVEVYADVTDTRGRLGATSTQVTILPYTQPKITMLKVHRCKQDGTEDDRGSYAKVTYSYDVDPLDGKNGMSMFIQYKKTTDTQFTSVELPGGFSAENRTFIFEADDAYAYDVQLLLADSLVSVGHSTTISTGFTLIHYGASGKSITFGGIDSTEGVHIMNLPFTIDGVDVDYIVEQGTDTGWYYRKWNSGVAECWKTFQQNGIKSSNTNYSGFHYSEAISVYFPFEFVEAPTVTVDGGSMAYMNFVRVFYRYGHGVSFVVVSMIDNGYVDVIVDVKAIGRWK